MTTGTSGPRTQTPPTARPRPPMPPGGYGAGTRSAPQPSPVTGRVAPSAAAIARPLLVLLPVLAFLAPALLISLTRTPTYTAEARMLIGGFDVQSQAVPGYVEASRVLAETYSRLVETDAIIEPVAESLGVPPDEVKGHISATSVPESSIIRVKGSGASTEEAIRFADAAAAALVEYADTSSDESALDAFEEASISLREAQAAQAEAEQALASAQANGSATQVANAREAVAQAEAAVERAQLERDGAAERYQSESSRGGARPQIVAEAVDTGSDRRSTIMLAIAACLGLGLIVGVALATVVVNRQVAAAPPRP